MLRYVERGYATVCCLNLSVRLSVRLSVTFRYRDHIGWNTSKTILQGPSEQKLLKNLGEKGAWVYPLSRDGPIFRIPPIISGTHKATNFKFGRYIHRVHATKSRLKIWKKREYPGTSQIFWVFPFISGTGKATDFKFGNVYSQGPCEQKPLKIGQKRVRGCIQGLPNFLSTLYYLRNG